MSKKNLDKLLKEAAEKLEQRQFEQAEKLYREASALEPDNAAVAMGLAMIFNRTGTPEQALPLLEQIWKALKKSRSKKIAPSKATILAQMALAYEQLGQIEQARTHYQQAHDIFPNPQLAQQIERLENHQGVARSPEQLTLLGQRLAQKGNAQEAEKLIRAALKINPDYPPALNALGLLYRAQKDYNASLPLLQQAIILDPEKPNYYNDLGMLFQDRGELEKAISFHKRAIKVNPDFVPAYINLGVAYKRLNQLDDAIASYRHAIVLDPNAAAAHNNLGNLLRLQGDLKGARKFISRALEIKPDYPDAIENLKMLDNDER